MEAPGAGFGSLIDLFFFHAGHNLRHEVSLKQKLQLHRKYNKMYIPVQLFFPRKISCVHPSCPNSKPTNPL